MQCSKCDKENPDGIAFCNSCGAFLRAPQPTKKQNPRRHGVLKTLLMAMLLASAGWLGFFVCEFINSDNIDNLNIEIAELKGRISDLQRERDARVNVYEDARAKVNQLKKELERKEREISELNDVVKRMSDEKDTISASKNALVASLQASKETIAKLQREKDASVKVDEDARAKMNQLKQEIKRKEIEISELNGVVKRLSEENASLKEYIITCGWVIPLLMHDIECSKSKFQ